MVAIKENTIRLKKQDSSSSLSSAEIETNDLNKNKQPPAPIPPSTLPRKSVRFAPEVDIYDVEHVNDMSDEEVASVWYARAEFVQIRAEYQVTVRIMSTARDLSESDEHCTRGLEYRTRTGSRARQLNKLTAVAAVLDEQERQYNGGMLDDEALSRVYQHVNYHCREAALELGMNDAQEAHGSDYYYNTFGMVDKPQRKSADKKKPTRVRKMFKQASLRRLQVLDDIKTIMRRNSSRDITAATTA